MSILLVDDETELTEPLCKILSREGYTIDVANNGNTGIRLALSNNYDLLILDWMLPHKSGLEICQELRVKGLTTPVLFLTAKDTIDDRVLGLDAGADDYIVKPFELRELLARVRALLRRGITPENTETNKLKVADLELDKENYTAYRNQKAIDLSEKELELLEYFMENSGQLLTHEAIYNHLWQDSEQPSSNVLAALVRLLRRKIEIKGQPVLIHTVYGKGYRFGLSE
ncbi:Response regulator MprA [Hyella patelloides LEGE 07179]|uniref:Response regulator MprA n=1 Tax=Hyella patelloides LEGE 07179 TaxID=945734 RepID=A0A563VVA5_9CYAN|nr:two-component system response regulator RppA [Hyella patelloides]VEP15362.1 Response regulator MprA [Hyella patelloides LEGE 07179]